MAEGACGGLWRDSARAGSIGRAVVPHQRWRTPAALSELLRFMMSQEDGSRRVTVHCGVAFVPSHGNYTDPQEEAQSVPLRDRNQAQEEARRQGEGLAYRAHERSSRTL